MWSSNAPWSFSGYGVFTRDILKRMYKDGWPVAGSFFYGLEGNPIEWNGITCYAKMNDPWGGDALYNHSLDFKANIAFSMQDIQLLDLNFLGALKQKNIPYIPYLPIDHEPVSDAILQRLNLAYKIITFSKYGQKTLEDKGYSSKLIVEGIDTNIFKPMDKTEMRKKYNIPQDMFLFLMVAANKENPPRKGFQEVLESFSQFQQKHPNSGIYFHTQQLSPTGFPIQQYVAHLGLKNIFFYDQYLATWKSGSEEVAEQINMSDVVLQPSQTEGFGMLSIEAQACGKPIIVQRCTSMPELVIEGKTGWICETQKKWWRGGGYVFMANPVSLYEKMEEVFAKLSGKNTIDKDARKNVLDNYDIDKLYEKEWKPLLESLQEDIVIDNKKDK